MSLRRLVGEIQDVWADRLKDILAVFGVREKSDSCRKSSRAAPVFGELQAYDFCQRQPTQFYYFR